MVLLLPLLHALDAFDICLLMMELSVHVSRTGRAHSLRVSVGPCHLHTSIPSTEKEPNICLTELNS